MQLEAEIVSWVEWLAVEFEGGAGGQDVGLDV